MKNCSVIRTAVGLSLVSGILCLCGQAEAQPVQLKNDSAQIPLSGGTFPAAIQVGFGPGEEALAIFAVPVGTSFPLEVSSLGLLWFSQFSAQLGPDFGGTQTLQEGFKFYAGNSPDPRTMTLVTTTNPPQLTDGFFNVFNLAGESVVISNPVTYIGASLQFDTQASAGDYTNQAPNGSLAAASVCYDRTSGNPNLNWIFSPTATATSTGMRSGWIRYQDLRASVNSQTPPSGFDLVLRIFIQPHIVPCTVDINGDGVVDGSDFTAFINSFGVGDPAIDPAADYNVDGLIDGNDFVAFINDFGAGC